MGNLLENEKLNINRRLNDLRERYANKLPKKIEQLESAWDRVAAEEWSEASVAELRAVAHGMAGSGAPFGYERMGSQAAELLALLSAKQAAPEKKGPTDLEEVNQRIALIRNASRNPGPRAEYSPSVNAVLYEQRSRLLYLVEDDKEFAADLAEQLSHFDYDTRIFPHPEGIEVSMRTEKPAAIIMDIAFGKEEGAGIRAVQTIRDQDEVSAPILFISARRDLDTRLRAVHAGGDAYFSKPLNVPALIEKLEELTVVPVGKKVRILIIDDDELLGEHYKLLLQEGDMEAEHLTDPADLFATLEKHGTDLILMDYQLRDHLGTDIMRVLRQHERWSGIPVVFISSTVDERKQVEALLTGGDIFLKKPITREVLINTLRYRADRAQKTRDRLRTDGLSGLLNHNSIKTELAHLNAESLRTGKNLCLAMVDLDEFKLINDTYGHQTGDRVIKCVSRLFKERLRAADRAGRYGGEEFLLLFPETDAQTALNLLNEIRKDFAQLRQVSDDGREFFATMSAGLTETDGQHRGDFVLKAADEALYKSKDNGRNQINSAPRILKRTRSS